ncbi:MAG: LPXTG cell wall anchor domain-containing protein [Treponema sp.]|nr:LPXTG cell wall anchor domain-containing protein [Treponema sp.]
MIAVISYALYSVFVEKASDFTGEEITFAMLLAGVVLIVAGVYIANRKLKG